MANVLFCSDYHLGHGNIIKYREEFTSHDEMQSKLKKNWHKKVTKRDIVFCLGDMLISKEAIQEFKTWTAFKKVLILGNHCTERNNITVSDLLEAFDEIHGVLKYKEFWLTHTPIHPAELRGKINIHGHVHNHSIDDNRYINACPEVNDYSPISLHDVRRKIYHGIVE